MFKYQNAINKINKELGLSLKVIEAGEYITIADKKKECFATSTNNFENEEIFYNRFKTACKMQINI